MLTLRGTVKNDFTFFLPFFNIVFSTLLSVAGSGVGGGSREAEAEGDTERPGTGEFES